MSIYIPRIAQIKEHFWVMGNHGRVRLDINDLIIDLNLSEAKKLRDELTKILKAEVIEK